MLSEKKDKATPQPAQDLAGVIENRMCIGCGACVHADQSLRLVFDERGQMYAPSGPGTADAAAVCPAVQVDFDFLQRRVFGDAPRTPLGVVAQVLLAQSTDEGRNLRASSGGLIKEMLRSLLARDDVDGAIALAQVGGLHFEPILIRTAEEVDQLPGSIYHALPFDGALRLLRENAGRFVLVAIPCQLEGIYSYIHQLEPALAERIHSTIGLLCGWQYTHHALRAICTFKNIDFEHIEEIAFRGGGPVGKLRMRTPQGEFEIHRRVDLAYQVAFDRSFNTPRCHLCINHSNFLADVVIGDAWLPSTVHTKAGISLLICRTPASVSLIQQLRDEGRIVTADVTMNEVIESQTRRVAFGDFSYAYAEYLRDRGAYCPEMVGPNRSAARLWSRRRVARFHAELQKKLELQYARRYRTLFWRKFTLEVRPFLYRYIRWFFVRILKLKSLLGMSEEVASAKLDQFR